MTISYNGENFYGMAKQPNKRSVQEELEKEFSVLFNEPIKINYSGRTDKHVHAKEQVINFLINPRVNINLHSIKKVINSKFDDIQIKDIKMEKGIEKHPRYDCVSKTYEYVIDNNIAINVIVSFFIFFEF